MSAARKAPATTGAGMTTTARATATAKPPAAKKLAAKASAPATSTAKTANAKKSATTAPSAPAVGPFGWAVAPRAPGERRHWLMKSEPDVFSFDDLLAAPGRTTHWDGVRNYVARNLMQHGMRVGDLVLFYHSNAEPSGVAGIAEVVREAYPDPSQFDPRSEYFDPASRPGAPTWVMVDVRAVEKLPRVVTLEELRADPALEGLETARRGSRLSVHPVSEAHFRAIVGSLAAGRPALTR